MKTIGALEAEMLVGQYVVLYWPLRDQTRSASAIQFPPPTPTMVPNMRGLVIVDTRSGLVFE